MCNLHCLEAVERTLRDVMNNSFDFGYKAVLVSGDFRQILPVIPGGSRADIVEKCFKASPLYDKFNVLRLTENMRLAELRVDPNADPEALEFPEFLLKVGEGRDAWKDRLAFLGSQIGQDRLAFLSSQIGQHQGALSQSI